jgi:hypothetical protein
MINKNCETRGVWTSPRRERWRVFACAAHADRFGGPQWRDVRPLDDAARSELVEVALRERAAQSR